MSFEARYTDLIRRHLGREPRRGDGLPLADVKACERRLGLSLPGAMRAYYRMAGRLEALNRAHNQLYGLDEIRLEGTHLVFMEENQAVVFWGVKLKEPMPDDPIVLQRANADGAQWYSEKLRFSTFLIRTFDWQAGFADPPG